MKITRDNYEEYFIDHFDGKLDAVQTAELFLFLDAHPDLKQEFELFGGLTLDEHTEHFDGKDSLKRGEITSANAGHYFVASLEGDLTPEEEQQLEQYVATSEERRKEQQLYMMTRLPAETVAFPGKAQLRQPIHMSSWFIGTVRYAAAAAIVLMILSGGYLVITRTQKGGVQVADGTTQETPAAREIQTEEVPTASVNSGSVTGEPASAPSSVESAAPSSNTVKKQPAAVRHRQTVSQQLAASQPVIKQEVPETVQPKESINSPETEQPVAQQPSVQTQPEQQPVAMAAQPASGAGYMTVLQAVKQRAEKELTAQDETTPEQDLATLEGKRKGGVKVLGILSKGLQKVAGEKVSLSTAYDVDGQMMAYEFKAGGITIQK